jgi:hypothetical protein
LRLQPGDAVAELYLQRVHDYARKPPEPDWDGILKLDEK